MDLSLNHILQLLLLYKYVILFPISIVEGPIITILGGFLAASGYMNIYLVYLLVIAGDIVGDTIFYYLGRKGRVGFLRKFGRYFGISEDKISQLESHFQKHAGKTLMAGKFTHSLGTVVLVSAGMANVKYSKFIIYNFFSTAVKSVILLFIGYYFGRAYQQINQYFDYATYITIGVAMVLVVVYLIGAKRIKQLL